MKNNKVIIWEENETFPIEKLESFLFSLGFFDFSFHICQNFEQCKQECLDNFDTAVVICDNSKLDNLLENIKEDGDVLNLLFEQSVTVSRGEKRMLLIPLQLPYEKFLKEFLGESDIHIYSVFGKTVTQIKSIFDSIRCDYKIITKTPILHTIYCFTAVNEELVKSAIGDFLYSFKDESLTNACVRKLREKSMSISVVEQATCGLVCGSVLGKVKEAYILTDENDFLKFDITEELLREKGFASKELSFELTKNLLKKSQTDLAISVLGEKGRFFVSIGDSQNIYVFSTSFEGDKKQVLDNVVDFTLFRLLKILN